MPILNRRERQSSSSQYAIPREARVSQGMVKIELSNDLSREVQVLLQVDRRFAEYGRALMTHLAKGCGKNITLTVLQDDFPYSPEKIAEFEKSIKIALDLHKRDGNCSMI